MWRIEGFCARVVGRFRTFLSLLRTKSCSIQYPSILVHVGISRKEAHNDKGNWIVRTPYRLSRHIRLLTMSPASSKKIFFNTTYPFLLAVLSPWVRVGHETDLLHDDLGHSGEIGEVCENSSSSELIFFPFRDLNRSSELALRG
jgi:hypothetical protein